MFQIYRGGKLYRNYRGTFLLLIFMLIDWLLTTILSVFQLNSVLFRLFSLFDYFFWRFCVVLFAFFVVVDAFGLFLFILKDT